MAGTISGAPCKRPHLGIEGILKGGQAEVKGGEEPERGVEAADQRHGRCNAGCREQQLCLGGA